MIRSRIGVVVYMMQCTGCTYLFLGGEVFSAGDFVGAFFASMVLNYYITAFLFGWRMPTITLTLVRGTHDPQRIFVFLFFCFLWSTVFLPLLGGRYPMDQEY